jgi:hypothetical protein
LSSGGRTGDLLLGLQAWCRAGIKNAHADTDDPERRGYFGYFNCNSARNNYSGNTNKLW